MYKVLFISNMYPSCAFPSFGTFVKKNQEQLNSMGFDTSKAIVIDKKGGTKIQKVKRYITFFLKAFQAVKSLKYDFIYVHYLTYSTIPILALYPFFKFKYYINIHGDDLVGNRLIHRLMSLGNSYLLLNAIGIVVPSDYFKDILLKKYPYLNVNNIHVSYSGGIDSDIFKPTTPIPNKKDYLWVSRIEEGKGWLVLLNALVILKSKYGINIRVSVLGAGNQVTYFKERVMSLGLTENVEYLGEVSHDEVVDFFDSAKFFIFTTERESLGLVLLESFAMRTPAIVSNIKPLNLIADKNSAFFFKSLSPDELAKSLRESNDISDENYYNLTSNAMRISKSYSSKVVTSLLHEFIVNTVSNNQ